MSPEETTFDSSVNFVSLNLLKFCLKKSLFWAGKQKIFSGWTNWSKRSEISWIIKFEYKVQNY